MNPPYPFVCISITSANALQLAHVGHSAEISYKIPAIREQFPGKINYLASVHDGEITKWTEGQYKIGFPDENWQVPPYFIMQLPPGRLLCFEELLGISHRYRDSLLVPSHAHFGFDSQHSANLYRKNALEMCNITAREEYPKTPKFGFFLERGFERQLSNAGELCSQAKTEEFKSMLPVETVLIEHSPSRDS